MGLAIGTSEGEVVSLAAMDADMVQQLAAGLSEISPWSLYGIGADEMARFFGPGDNGGDRYVVCVGDVAAGVLVVRPKWLRGPYLHFLGLLPAFQGRGIGGLILDWLENQARGEAGNRHIWILASEFNHGARAFYRRNGYEEVAPIDDVIADGVAEVLLRKRLA